MNDAFVTVRAKNPFAYKGKEHSTGDVFTIPREDLVLLRTDVEVIESTSTPDRVSKRKPLTVRNKK